MYSQWEILDGKEFKVNGGQSVDVRDRLAGQLVKLDVDGKVTTDTGADNLYYPVKDTVGPLTDGDIVNVQLTGVAKVFVETATGIVAGATVIVGPLGRGVVLGALPGEALATSAAVIGIAQYPAAGKSHIPVLLNVSTVFVS